MKGIKLNEEEVKTLLPLNIQETNVISNDAKKVLASILNYHRCLDIVKECGYLVCPNEALRESSGIKYNNMIKAIQELIEYGLIKRDVGKKWKHGEKHTASKYFVKWENLTKELKKKTFEDMFSDFMKRPEIKEGTIDIDNDIDNDIDYDNENDIDNETDTVIDIDNIKYIDINKDNNINIKNDLKYNIMDKPKNYKELSEYIKEKVLALSKDCSTVEEYEGIKNQIILEIEEEYSHIPSYKSCIYSINGYFNKKEDDLFPTGEDPVGTLYTSMPC